MIKTNSLNGTSLRPILSGRTVPLFLFGVDLACFELGS